ncbi:hypothetical protein K469DRAFT_19887 [Zopfia rhizophila CBS 207.26]|uniref:Uncharacterized protein n=1 Tax=Zopfia rhizophila CBS 207.26 TaxID=1314779 RepID=A0A6A6EXA8_9PEZI|nr:hypothetical protein K469DRAFT_19887 [Zopfia rhizophila CBS 207.26]
MARITDPPAEIVANIFELVQHEMPETIPKLLYTSKTPELHESTRFVLYKNVCIPWSLKDTCPLLKPREANTSHSLFRSLRIRFDNVPLSAFEAGDDMVYSQADLVCEFLPRLTKLATFSINLNRREVDEGCLRPPTEIAQLLRPLPRTVVNLEADTANIDGMWEDDYPSTHLCPTISDMLLRLQRSASI